jgi:hypothetical protein
MPKLNSRLWPMITNETGDEIEMPGSILLAPHEIPEDGSHCSSLSAVAKTATSINVKQSAVLRPTGVYARRWRPCFATDLLSEGRRCVGRRGDR